MLVAAPAATAFSASDTPDPRWAELEHWTLEACVLRAEGREDEAVRVLQERLPPLIQAWSASCGLLKAELQDRLRRLFADSQTFVSRGLAQRRLITAGLIANGLGSAVPLSTATSQVAPSPACTPAAAPRPLGLRRSVPVGDIVGMLDGLAEAEREARREAIWPLRSSLTRAAAALA